MELLKRGQERFNIFCSPCHGRLGDGKGIVVERGYSPPPTFHSDRVRSFPDGHIFDVITNGIRNMPPYGPQIPASDRWAIVAYFRALQRSQNATVNDIPVELRDQVK
jgi:mono/diheme cytochrome c family protein